MITFKGHPLVGGVGKKPHGRRKGRSGGGGGALLQPDTLLSGKKLKRSANALTRIELLPALHGYRRELTALEAQRQGQEKGLYDLQNRTSQNVAGAYGNLAKSSAQSQARTQAVANLLNQNTQQIEGQAQQNLQAAQQGELGDMTQALASRNVDPGGSAAGAALAQQVSQQQQAAAQRAAATSAYANAQGGAWSGYSGALGQAEQMRGGEAQKDILNAVADRIAQANADAYANEAEARGKLADTKALWGPTRLKNLLQLRGSERDYSLSANPPTKRSVSTNVYKGLPKHPSHFTNTYKGLPKPGRSGGSSKGGKKRKPGG